MAFDWSDFHKAMTNCPDFEIDDLEDDECCGLACGTCPGCPSSPYRHTTTRRNT